MTGLVRALGLLTSLSLPVAPQVTYQDLVKADASKRGLRP